MDAVKLGMKAVDELHTPLTDLHEALSKGFTFVAIVFQIQWLEILVFLFSFLIFVYLFIIFFFLNLFYFFDSIKHPRHQKYTVF